MNAGAEGQTVAPAPELVLLDFQAGWCVQCRVQAAALRDLEQRYSDRFRVDRVDVEERPLAAKAYRVAQVPTLLAMKNGVEVRRLVGVQPLDTLLALAQSLLDEAGDAELAHD